MGIHTYGPKPNRFYLPFALLMVLMGCLENGDFRRVSLVIQKKGEYAQKRMAASELDCFFLSVTGEGIGSGLATGALGPSVSVSCLDLGLVSAAASLATATGAGIKVLVKPGASRKFRVLGFSGLAAVTNQCDGAQVLSLLQSASAGSVALYELGHTTVDIQSDTQVTVTNTFDGSDPTDLLAQCLTGTSSTMGSWVGTKQFGTGPNNYDTEAKGVAVDASGNVFVAGYVGSSPTNEGLDGVATTGSFDAFLRKYSHSGSVLWTRQLGVSSSSTRGAGLVLDSSGNAFVAGVTDGNLDGNTLAGVLDLFLTKYDTSGNKLWTQQLGVSAGTTSVSSVAVDTSGNVFVAGSTDLGLDGNSLMGTYDFFVTKYSNSGTKQWTKQLGVGGANTYGQSVATDSGGNVYVAGFTSGSLDGQILQGNYDYFYTKYTGAGLKLFTHLSGTTGANVQAYGITVDSSSNVYITGATDSDLDAVLHTGSADAFVVKINSSQTRQWTTLLGASGVSASGTAITVDPSGAVVVTGTTTGGIDGNIQTGTGDFFTSKFDSGGNKQWTRQLGAIGYGSDSQGIAADSLGNVFVSGTTTGDLDGNVSGKIGTFEAFLSSYDPTGTKL